MTDVQYAYHTVVKYTEHNMEYEKPSSIITSIADYFFAREISNYGKIELNISVVPSVNEFLQEIIDDLADADEDFEILYFSSPKLLVYYDQLYFTINWTIEGDKYVFSILFGTEYSIDDDNNIYVYCDEDDSDTIVGDDD